MNKRTFVLAILDGWGIGSHNRGNPIYIANPDNINYIKNNFPISAIQASGIAVGLPWDATGNSEVGHLTIGAGKTLYQHFPKISISIDNGSFFKNPALKNGFNHALKNQSAVHLFGCSIADLPACTLVAVMHKPISDYANRYIFEGFR